jgi:cold shock CspA family protein
VISADGALFGFHSTAIVDGSRQIASGAKVTFSVVAAPCGRFEATSVSPLGL